MPKLGGLQLLRAFAAIIVLVGHAIAEAEHYFGLSLHLDIIPWTRGVDIFFVISGFIITLSATRYWGRPIAFLQRRAMRVIPLYYFFTTLMVITVLAFPNGPKDTVFDLGQIASSYGFIPYERSDGRIAPVLSLGWTLNYEVFFYALCALTLMLRNAMQILCCGIIGLIAAGALISINSTPWVFWTNPIMIEFIFGILLAKAYQSGHVFSNTSLAITTFVLGLCLLILLDLTDLPRFIAAGLPATIIVAAGTLFCPPIQTSWQILGDASYALYLSHRFTLRAGTLLLLPVLPNGVFGSWIYILSVSILSIGVAVLTHLWLERPFFMSQPKRRLA